MGSIPSVNYDGPNENQANDISKKFQGNFLLLAGVGLLLLGASYQGLARLADVTRKRLRVTRWEDGGGLKRRRA